MTLYNVPEDKWLSLDSSKMSDYQRCPRYFFYRHIVGWEVDRTNHDLVFGSAWHAAKEDFIQSVASFDNTPIPVNMERVIIAKAMGCFNAIYRKEYSPQTDSDNAPKEPAAAEAALFGYGEQIHWKLPFTLETLNDKPATEVYGVVPISEERVIRFRMDVVASDAGIMHFRDHKTASMNSPTFQARYAMSIQMGTYHHALCCIYPPEKVFGGYVDVTVFKKSGCEHLTIPIMKSIGNLQEWLWRVNRITDDVEHDILSLQKASPGDPVFTSFQQNENGCTAYNRKCKYYDLCMSWPNPLAHIADGHMPAGMKVEVWDPAEHEAGKNYVEVK